MDGKSTSNIALYAIHPEFAERIFNGEKKVEFRKKRPKENFSHVLVYVTSPLKKVVGVFVVERIDEGSPEEIWGRYQEVGGIAKEDFLKYYGNSECSIAIVIGEVTYFQEPFDLCKISGTATPPQSFQYLPTSVLSMLSA